MVYIQAQFEISRPGKIENYFYFLFFYLFRMFSVSTKYNCVRPFSSEE